MPRHSADSPTFKINWLTIDGFEYLCFNLTRRLMTFKEPFPDYCTRNNSLLESALGSPQQKFGGKLLYPTIIEQGAILFYSLIKNHPFLNGNKRIAIMALLVFLALNKKWLSIPSLVLYYLATDVSKSDPGIRTKVLSRIGRIIKKFIQPFPNSSF